MTKTTTSTRLPLACRSTERAGPLRPFGRALAVAGTLLAFALAVAATSRPAAGDCGGAELPATLYGLSQEGRMTVNGTTTETYATDFSIDVDVDDDWWVVIDPGGGYWGDPLIEIDIEHPEDLWSSLDADGADRYALQRGGRMKKNDKTAYDLPYMFGQAWLDMTAGGGHQYSIRSDGALAVDDRVVVDRSADGFAFRRVYVDADTVYVLRSDGNVYRDEEQDALFAFRAGRDTLDANDGGSIRTAWTALAVDPAGEYLYALRTDGNVYRGQLPDGPKSGEPVASLPYVGVVLLNYGERYQDLVFTPDGTWYVLRADGHVYTRASQIMPLVDLPGDANDIDRLHVDLDTFNDSWLALRSDGRVYLDGGSTEILDLSGDLYGSMALAAAPPTLPDDGSTKTPKATEIKSRTVVGTPLRIPVTVNDADTCPDEIVVVPTELPAGSRWETEPPTFVWDAPGEKGKYKVKFTVSDGISSRNVKWTVQVKNPDLDLEKNKAPLVAKYDSAQAIIGIEYALLIVADDKDGDALTYSVNTTKFPFDSGATFDPETQVFRWTPRVEDQGSTTVKFKVSDGRKEKTISVKVKVKAGLF